MTGGCRATLRPGRRVVDVAPGTSLYDKVSAAQAALASNDVRGACSTLGALMNDVSAQSDTHV